MKIKLVKGKKGEKDQKIYIETNGAEAFKHKELMVLLNQLSINEFYIYKNEGWDKKGKEFLFPIAIMDAIRLGMQGINLKENNEELKDYCRRNYLK